MELDSDSHYYSNLNTWPAKLTTGSQSVIVERGRNSEQEISRVTTIGTVVGVVTMQVMTLTIPPHDAKLACPDKTARPGVSAAITP